MGGYDFSNLLLGVPDEWQNGLNNHKIVMSSQSCNEAMLLIATAVINFTLKCKPF